MSSTCSRTDCRRPSIATLTYDYGAQVATLDDLAPPHPMHYDLCAEHADRLAVPNGWQRVDRRSHRSPVAPDAGMPGQLAS